MTLRDLGYKPYDGPRRPPSHATWVMLRYGLARALDPVLVKIVVILGAVPGLLFVLFGYFATKMTDTRPEPAAWLSNLCAFQTWTFVGLLGLLAGARTVSEDLRARTFPLLFSKPLTPTQYLVGRTAAIGVLCFCLVFVPGAFFALGLSMAVPGPEALATAGLVFPLFAQSVVVAAVVASVSVGLSASSANPALPMSGWLALWIVPAVAAAIVRFATEQGFLDYASLPTLLSRVSAGLLAQRVEVAANGPSPTLAALAVGAYAVSALAFARSRLHRAEVVA